MPPRPLCGLAMMMSAPCFFSSGIQRLAATRMSPTSSLPATLALSQMVMPGGAKLTIPTLTPATSSMW
ncbi:hypothetical protein D3C86_2207450 [compost metagenome]